MLNNNSGNGGASIPLATKVIIKATSIDDVSTPRHRAGSPNAAAAATPTNTNTTTTRYGGTEAQEMYAVEKGMQESTNSYSNAVIVPPHSTCTPRRNAATSAAATEANNEGECTVVPDDDHDASSATCMGKVRYFLLNNDPLLYAVLKWSLAALLLLFLAFIVFGMLYSGVSYDNTCSWLEDTTLEEGMHGRCHTPFGTILGSFENTFSYSNCNDEYVSISNNYMNLMVPTLDAATGLTAYNSKEFYTGLEWQCVEYARRYWMLNGRPKPAYFGSVDGAADIWNLTEVRLLENTTATLPLHKYKSGDRVVQDGLKAPQKGDLIIYPIQPNGFPVGHVAVITKVEMGDRGFIYVAEQNWGSGQWSSPFHNYSRKIPLHYDAVTTAIMLDDPAGRIIGWMRYG